MQNTTLCISLSKLRVLILANSFTPTPLLLSYFSATAKQKKIKAVVIYGAISFRADWSARLGEESRTTPTTSSSPFAQSCESIPLHNVDYFRGCYPNRADRQSIAPDLKCAMNYEGCSKRFIQHGRVGCLPWGVSPLHLELRLHNVGRFSVNLLGHPYAAVER